MLNQEYYKVLGNLAQCSFEDSYHGLNVALESDPNFKKYMERPYRLKAYQEELDFFMTANERNFHLIGFLDAIICLERMGLIFWTPLDHTADIDEEVDGPDSEEECAEFEAREQEFAMQCEAMQRLIWYVETGEE